MRESVCAMVLTYNRKDLLSECLKALSTQTRPPDKVIVVNNASTDGTTQMLAEAFPAINTMNLSENLGASFGFHLGMKWAFEEGYDWVWMLDDDAIPASQCLEKLLENSRPDCVIVPVPRDENGAPHSVMHCRRGMSVSIADELASSSEPIAGNLHFTWQGPLVSRGIIEHVGLVRKEFFFAFDDFEYAMRVHRYRADAVIAVPTAMIHHKRLGTPWKVKFLWYSRTRYLQPPGRLYYSNRNAVYTYARLYPDLRKLAWHTVRQSCTLALDLAFGPDRGERLKMHVRSVWDGVSGKLGKRYEAA